MSDVQTKGLFGTALPPFLATIQAHNEAYNAALVAADEQPVRVEDLRTVAQAVVEAWTRHHLHHLAHATEALCAQMQALEAVLREEEPPVKMEDLRTVDGLRLCHLAWQFGLAPPHVTWNMLAWCYPMYWAATPWGGRVACRWEPHVNRDQASGLLRDLGSQGWATTVSTVPPLGGVVGCVEATKAGQTVRAYWGGGAFVDHEEAVAVLRLSVLAMAMEGTAP